MFKDKFFNFLFILIFLVPVLGGGCNIFGEDEEEQQTAETPAETPVEEPPAEPPHISGSSSGGEAGTIGG